MQLLIKSITSTFRLCPMHYYPNQSIPLILESLKSSAHWLKLVGTKARASPDGPYSAVCERPSTDANFPLLWNISRLQTLPMRGNPTAVACSSSVKTNNVLIIIS